MYDRTELMSASDRFWDLILSSLNIAPFALTRNDDLMSQWTSPDLVLSQTCGLPYARDLSDRVHLVGTPDYNLRGCAPGYYCSAIVMREADANPRGQHLTVAVNDLSSQSGWGALCRYLAAHDLTPFDKVLTGSHLASAKAVLNGRADLAAIDGVTWGYMERFGDCAGLSVIARTDPTPGLPYITARVRNPAVIARAIETAIDDMSTEDRDLLGIRGLVQIPRETYEAINQGHGTFIKAP